MPYPESINLPFNFSSIKDDFKLHYQTEAQQSDKPGYWAIMQGSNILVTQKGAAGAFQLPEGELPGWLVPKRAPVTIGEWQGKPLRAFIISKDLVLEGAFIAEAFNAGSNVLDIRILTLGGIAKQVLHWLNRSIHCSHCGTDTDPIYGTWGKKCPACRAEHYPHIHPCAIVLIKRGNEVLLTRKAEWVPGRYSLVAGFVDFGESLEECAHPGGHGGNRRSYRKRTLCG